MRKIHSDHSHSNKNKGQLFFWNFQNFPFLFSPKWKTHMGFFLLVPGCPPWPQPIPIKLISVLFSCLDLLSLAFPSTTLLPVWRYNQAGIGNWAPHLHPEETQRPCFKRFTEVTITKAKERKQKLQSDRGSRISKVNSIWFCFMICSFWILGPTFVKFICEMKWRSHLLSPWILLSVEFLIWWWANTQ